MIENVKQLINNYTPELYPEIYNLFTLLDEEDQLKIIEVVFNHGYNLSLDYNNNGIFNQVIYHNAAMYGSLYFKLSLLIWSDIKVIVNSDSKINEYIITEVYDLYIKFTDTKNIITNIALLDYIYDNKRKTFLKE